MIVGDADDLVCEEFEIDRVNWHLVAAGADRGSPCHTLGVGVNAPGYNDRFEATVKIRYNHPGTLATVTLLENDRAHVRLHDPQRAVTPGQAAVIYDCDVVLGGGWICSKQNPSFRAKSRNPEAIGKRDSTGSFDSAALRSG